LNLKLILSNNIKYRPRASHAISDNDSGFDSLLGYLQKSLKPYKVMEFRRLPKSGFHKDRILSILSNLIRNEDKSWNSGRVSGAVYHGETSLFTFIS